MLESEGEIVVFVTASSEEEAAGLARTVVEADLAACANVLPGIRSIFRWEGAVVDEREALIILKSRADLFDDLASLLKRHHSYSVPEIIAVPIAKGSADYLSWIRDVTRK